MDEIQKPDTSTRPYSMQNLVGVIYLILKGNKSLRLKNDSTRSLVYTGD